MDYEAWAFKPEHLIEYEAKDNPRKFVPIINNESCGARNLSASFFKLSPGKVSEKGVHLNEEEMYYVVSGKAKLTIGDKNFLVEKGMIIFIPPGEWHQSISIGETDLCYLCVFSPQVTSDFNEKDWILHKPK